MLLGEPLCLRAVYKYLTVHPEQGEWAWLFFMNKCSPLTMLTIIYNFRLTVSTIKKFIHPSKENINISKLKMDI